MLALQCLRAGLQAISSDIAPSPSGHDAARRRWQAGKPIPEEKEIKEEFADDSNR
jgi:hypothetical protein